MIFELIFLIFPTLASGLAFILCLKLSQDRFNNPLDFNLKWRGKRLVGSNKTFKGPICMGIFSMIFGSLTYLVLKDHLVLTASGILIAVNFLLIGLIYSFSELPNSFIKRQLSIPPGGVHKNQGMRLVFKLVDTFDSLIFIGIAYKLLFNLQSTTIMLAILIGGFLHLTTDRLMVKLSLKQKLD